MEINEREVYISPVIEEMMEEDLHFKKIVIFLPSTSRQGIKKGSYATSPSR